MSIFQSTVLTLRRVACVNLLASDFIEWGSVDFVNDDNVDVRLSLWAR